MWQTGLGPIVAKRLESRVKRVMTADFLFVAQAAPAAAVLHDAEQTGFCGIDILSQHSEHVFGLGAGVLYGLGVTNSSADSDVLISPFRRFRKAAPALSPLVLCETQISARRVTIGGVFQKKGST